MDKLAIELLRRVFSYLSLCGNGGAIALSATCRSLRQEVLAYQDFDESALTWEQGAIIHFEKRCSSFPEIANHNVRAIEDVADSVFDKINCKTLQMTGWLRATQRLQILPRPEILEQLFIERSYREGLRFLAEAEKECCKFITSERFPTLRTLGLSTKQLVSTLPKTVTKLLCAKLEGSSEEFTHLAETFPNLKHMAIGHISSDLLICIPDTVDTLIIGTIEVSSTSARDITHLASLPSLRRFKVSFSELGPTKKVAEKIKAALPSHLPPSLTELDLRAHRAHSSDCEILQLPKLQNLTLLRIEQPFFLDPRDSNPLGGLPNVRRLDLRIARHKPLSPYKNWRSILACVFEGLPNLKDLRLKVEHDERRVLERKVFMDELIRCGGTRPTVRVSVQDDYSVLFNDETRSSDFLPWIGLTFYQGQDPIILQNLHKFPNLQHLATITRNLSEVMLNQSLPPKLRTIYFEDSEYDDVTAQPLPEFNKLFEISLELDCIGIRYNVVAPFDADDLTNSPLCILKLEQNVILARRQGRVLVGRLPPMIQMYPDPSLRCVEHSEWYDKVGMTL